MAKIYSVCNQKGGVGKTTTAVNIAAFLSANAGRTLLIDLDPQGNATSASGIAKEQVDVSIYEVLADNVPAASIVKETRIPGLHVLPANTSLAGAEVELVSEIAREFKLREALREVRELYDYIIIDTPPSLSLLTINALAATDEVLIPIQCEYFALEGLSQLLKTIDLVRVNLHPELKIGGIIFTMYDSRLILNNEVLEEVKEHFPNLVFENTIPRNVRLSEAPSHGMPILFYDPTSTGSLAYEKLTNELIAREKEREAGIPEADAASVVHNGDVSYDQLRQDSDAEFKEEMQCQQVQNADLARALEH